MISPMPCSFLQTHKQIEDLLLNGDVERGSRLVGDQELRIAGNGDGDHHALALPSRHLVREVPKTFGRVGNADQLEKLDRAGAALRLVHLEIEKSAETSSIWKPTVKQGLRLATGS